LGRTCSRQLLALCLIAIPLSGHAEGGTDVDLLTLSLEELLQLEVTVGSLLESDQLHAASNVSVVAAADWRRYGARRTLDAIEHLPATLVLPAANGANLIAIRGYAQSSSARGIATSLDGIRLNNFLFGSAQLSTSDINLGVLDRIEMIRGPASAIYGSDAFHGVLAFYGFSSDKDLDEAEIVTGEQGYGHGAFRHSGTLLPDIRMNLAVAGTRQPDQERRYDLEGDPQAAGQSYIDKEQRYQSHSLSLKLDSDPRQELAWSWGLYADQLETDDFPIATATYASGQDTDNLMTRLAVTRQLDQQASLEASLYYRTSDQERKNVAPAGSVFPGGINLVDEHSYGASLTLRQPRQTYTQWALSLGYDAQVVERADLHVQTAQGGFDPVAFALVGGTRSREISSLVLEANTQLPGREQWSLVYGGRVDHYSDFGVQGSPRLGIIRQLTEDSAIKLLYGGAFRAPTAAELYIEPINNAGNQGNPDLNPEIMDTVELVWMKQTPTWQANLVLFENRWRDAISFVYLTPALGEYQNMGRSRAYGAETSLTWLWQAWTIDFNLSYTESRNEDTKEEYGMFPRWMANLELDYHWQALNLDLALINRTYSSVDERGFAPTPVDQTPVYWRTDVAATKHFGRNLDVYLNILNLFDRDNVLPAVFGTPNGIPGEPFNANIGFRLRF